MVDRRSLVFCAGLAAAAPLAAQAPADKVWRVAYNGYLPPASDAAHARAWDAFRAALRERGYRDRLKTARVLGPTIPQSLLLRADEAIQ